MLLAVLFRLSNILSIQKINKGVSMKKLFMSGLMLVVLFFSCTPVLAEMVMFNTKTLKYHKPSCRWAIKCTVNCIKIDKKEAIRRGGIPCKVCGG